jgi:hypothetical protein
LRGHTFVFDEVAHTRPPREDELGDILDDLGLVFRGESCKPLGEALLWVNIYSWFASWWGTADHFALPAEEDEVSGGSQYCRSCWTSRHSLDGHFQGEQSSRRGIEGVGLSKWARFSFSGGDM